MNNNINIDNYQAYYLDLIEGNINEKDKISLFNFLKLNPHLIINENEFLYTFSEAENNECLSPSFKQNLKIFDETEKITSLNIEHFIIAYYENILSPTKKIILQNYIKNNPLLLETFNLYKKTYLQNEEIIYPYKKHLKKGNKFYLYLSRSVAAILIILFTIYPINNKRINENYVSLNNNLTKENKINKEVIDNKLIDEFKNKNIKTRKLNNLKINHNNFNYLENNMVDKLKLNTLKFIEIDTFQKINTTDVNSNNNFVQNNNNKNINNIDNNLVSSRYLSINDMKEPIKLITEQFNKKFNTDLEIRTSKATSKKQGGFYFKFGNLEILRKKSATQEDLAFE